MNKLITEYRGEVTHILRLRKNALWRGRKSAYNINVCSSERLDTLIRMSINDERVAIPDLKILHRVRRIIDNKLWRLYEEGKCDEY